jgi:uncharacterized membrane protein
VSAAESWHSAAPWLLAGVLAGAGTMHFVAPAPFETLVPDALPGSSRTWVHVSGVAELTCALGLAVPATRRPAAWATAALFLAVFPGNVKMALDGGAQGVSGPMGSAALAWARLPLQIPLVLWAAGVARRARGRGLGVQELTDRVGASRP